MLLIYASMCVEPYRSQNVILKHEKYEFCKIPRPICVQNSSNLSQRCYKWFRKLSELLSVFKITQRIQNYSTYSELLHVFRITQRIHFLRGRAERRARNVSHLDRPWGVLSAYHALILVVFVLFCL